MSKPESKAYGSRLKEITEVLHKHGITRGVTPEKLRLILEDLGPTFIKLGQIMSMHSDILPKRYCDELMRLRSEVNPANHRRHVLQRAMRHGNRNLPHDGLPAEHHRSGSDRP